MKNINKIAEDILNKNVENEVIAFFEKNPNPSDNALHRWAEGKGYDVHEVEEVIYALATKFVLFITGGRAKEKNITKTDVNKKELAMGIKIEQEHIADDVVAERIALDHLAEMPDYYTKLSEMEASEGVKE
jgi:hypothetical protein